MDISVSKASDVQNTSGLNGGWSDLAEGVVIGIAVFSFLAIYNTIELYIVIFLSFVKHHGMYFWSLIIAGGGTVPFIIGTSLKFLGIGSVMVSLTLSTIGWWTMVTGQSLILWSRLHLIVHDQKILKWTLIMICVDAVLFHLPTSILTFGVNVTSTVDAFTPIYDVYEKIQMTAFTLQEFTISGIYIKYTIGIIRTTYTGVQNSNRKRKAKRMMFDLLGINFFIIVMDLCLLGLEYANQYVWENEFKALVYIIKVKLEFSVLNELMELVTGNANSRSDPMNPSSSGQYPATTSRSQNTAIVTNRSMHTHTPGFVDPTTTHTRLAVPTVKRTHWSDDDLDELTDQTVPPSSSGNPFDTKRPSKESLNDFGSEKNLAGFTKAGARDVGERSSSTDGDTTLEPERKPRTIG